LLDTHSGGGLTPAATATHLRDHGQGSWGARGVSVCMHVPGRSVTAASLIAVLPRQLDQGAPLRAYVALGSPCASIYVPAFLATSAGPPPFVPAQLWSETLWRAADSLRAHVENEPAARPAIRAVLDPVEDELWQEADDVVERPDRWAEVGRTWGQRALSAITSCLP
jgi:hypothetical protein